MCLLKSLHNWSERCTLNCSARKAYQAYNVLEYDVHNLKLLDMTSITIHSTYLHFRISKAPGVSIGMAYMQTQNGLVHMGSHNNDHAHLDSILVERFMTILA